MSEIKAPVVTPFDGLQEIAAKSKLRKRSTKRPIEKKEEEQVEAKAKVEVKEIQPEVAQPQPKVSNPSKKKKRPRSALEFQVSKRVRFKPPPSRPRPSSKPSSNIKETNTSAEKRKVLALLIAHGESKYVGPYLKERGFQLKPEKLAKYNLKKLQALQEEVEVTMANQGNTAIFDMLAQTAMEVTENVIHKNAGGRFQPKGTTELCWKNDTWRFKLEQWRLYNKIGIGFQNPLYELGAITFRTSMMVDARNKMRHTAPRTNLDDTVFGAPTEEKRE